MEFWGWPGGIDGPKLVYPTFQGQNPNVTVDFVAAPADQQMQKLTSSLVTGVGGPDIGGAFEANTEQFINPDWLTDLTAQITPIAANIVPGSLSVATTNDGKILGMPADASPCGLLYRADLFEKYGYKITDIATWDDFTRVGKEVVAKTNGNVKMLFLNRDDSSLNMQRLMHSELASGFFSQDASKVTVDDAANVQALTTTKAMWDAGIAWPDVTYDGQWAYMENDQLMTVPGPSWMQNAIQGSTKQQVGKWRLAKLPAFTAGGNQNARNSGATYMIPKNAKNPDAAWAFLQYAFGTPENQLAMWQKYFLFPSNKLAYTLPGFDDPVAFLGGQNANSLWADIYAGAPPYRFGPHFQVALSAVNAVVPSVIDGKMAPADALKQAADSVRQQTGLA